MPRSIRLFAGRGGGDPGGDEGAAEQRLGVAGIEAAAEPEVVHDCRADRGSKRPTSRTSQSGTLEARQLAAHRSGKASRRIWPISKNEYEPSPDGEKALAARVRSGHRR